MNKYFLLILTLGILSLFNACDPNKNDVIVNSEPKKDTTNKPHVNDIDTRHEKYIIFPNLEKVEELKADTVEYSVLNLKSYKKYNLKLSNYHVNYSEYFVHSHTGSVSEGHGEEIINEQYNNSINQTGDLLIVKQEDSVFTFEYPLQRTSYSKLYLILNIDFKYKIINNLTLKYLEDFCISGINFKTNFATEMKNFKYQILRDSTIYAKITGNDFKKSIVGYGRNQYSKFCGSDKDYDNIKMSVFNTQLTGNEEFEFTFSK